MRYWLVVWNHGILWLSIQLGMSSSQLTFTPSFFRGIGQPPRLVGYPVVFPIDSMVDRSRVFCERLPGRVTVIFLVNHPRSFCVRGMIQRHQVIAQGLDLMARSPKILCFVSSCRQLWFGTCQPQSIIESPILFCSKHGQTPNLLIIILKKCWKLPFWLRYNGKLRFGKLRFLSSVVFALTGGCYIDILISSKFNCLQGMIRLAGNTTTYCHRGISWIPKKMQARIDYKSLCWSGLCQKASTITIIFSCSPSKMEFAGIPVYPVVLSLAMVCWILLKFPCVLTEKTRWIHRFLLIYLHFF